MNKYVEYLSFRLINVHPVVKVKLTINRFQLQSIRTKLFIKDLLSFASKY
jgi:hypothetical protein